jgi:hypothetical protein
LSGRGLTFGCCSPGDAASVAYGPLPYGLFEQIRLKFITALKASSARTVRRTE